MKNYKYRALVALFIIWPMYLFPCAGRGALSSLVHLHLSANLEVQEQTLVSDGQTGFVPDYVN